jgi:hypothetical protein
MPTLGTRVKRGQQAQLQSYPDEYLECRQMGHQWHRVGYFESGGLVKRRITCQRCDTDRTDRWERDGLRRSPSYSYPQEYRLQGFNPPAQALRVETMRRATIYESEEAMLAALTNGAR